MIANLPDAPWAPQRISFGRIPDGIPESRIVLDPIPGTATEEDCLRFLESDDLPICELIDGVLVEKVMGFRESHIATKLIRHLENFIDPLGIGFLTGADGGVKLWKSRIRFPDIAYYAWTGMPGGRFPDKRIPEVVPDLSIEILSESNTAREMETKRFDFFGRGMKLCWEIDPDKRTIRVYENAMTFVELGESDQLTGGQVLPGFELAIRELFKILDRLPPT